MIRFYNTLSGKIEDFEPEGRRVGIYVCGLTVYDRMHIGHLRSMIAFDIVVRFLRKKGFELVYVRNFTDVDDKIIERAKIEGISPFDLAEKYISFFRKDIEPFELIRPDFEPRVTEHIQDIIDLIVKIMQRGHAYESQGDIYFDISSFPRYGMLSKRSKEELLAGVRVEPSEKKRDPLDFALWKAKKSDFEPSWKAPWGGEGRPGWHIECSAMSMKYLGETFDIHGGGQDLIFPHHENEIAQSESATGKRFVKYWMHTGYLTIKEQKMSKSLGNVVNVYELSEKYNPETIKFFIAKNHWRSPIDFSEEALRKDEKTLINFYSTLELELEEAGLKEIPDSAFAESSHLISQFKDAIEDDFNTPSAFSLVFSGFDDARKSKSMDELVKYLVFLKYVWEVSGLFGGIRQISGRSFIDHEVMRRCRMYGMSIDELAKLIEKRDELKRKKKFDEADKIRKKILDMGIQLQDTSLGTRKIPI